MPFRWTLWLWWFRFGLYGRERGRNAIKTSIISERRVLVSGHDVTENLKKKNPWRRPTITETIAAKFERSPEKTQTSSRFPERSTWPSDSTVHVTFSFLSFRTDFPRAMRRMPNSRTREDSQRAQKWISTNNNWIVPNTLHTHTHTTSATPDR